MIFYEALELTQLVARKSVVIRRANRLEPEFRLLAITLDVYMRGLME